ncbi:BglII/BstYI family type II restriction endonuclease [Spirosoma sp. KUDC1026]|uniref:BglII/BstYI family type II restriction endonuclease n=1 Tax=Spirosoma sp. KUDC1026 TaxID=2745947 RepID=UPI00159BD267|nr:BglII/BstYI family type II restriction endonuclease [Spirosoma sp. KUDC1026]QKZ15912.1 restriction endonuclease [Spirosoma sp. KUDC1026]
MRIAGIYSFNGGKEFVEENFPEQLAELKAAIKAIDASKAKTKKSKEQTMVGKMLYSPDALNKAFRTQLPKPRWKNVREKCEYKPNYYEDDYATPIVKKAHPFRDMDFVKDKLGIEVQFGKYSFMVYNVCAKMTIFKNLGHIIAGIEVVPVKELADEMSTGVSYYEQFVWDLENRGVSNIDIPVMIIGIAQ